MDYKEILDRAKSAYGTGAYDDATLEFIFPELAESEDERIRKGMIRFLNSEEAVGLFTYEARQSWIAHLEKQKEPKPAEWSEEDEEMVNAIIDVIPEDIAASDYKEMVDWLKSLRPKSKDEIYKEKVEAFKLGKHSLAARFENYLDENRPEGKMFLSIEECDDIDKAFEENNWEKIMRYANKYAWKPSEEHFQGLRRAILKADTGSDAERTLKDLYEQLKSIY